MQGELPSIPSKRIAADPLIDRCVIHTTWAVFLICLGCGEPTSNSSIRPDRPVESTGTKSIDPGAGLIPVTSDNVTVDSTASSALVELVEANWNDLQTLIGENKSKIVVVDVWSTACEPCMKEFPHLIEVQNKFGGDVVAVSFDVDYAGMKNKPVTYYRQRVLKFLGSMPESQVKHLMCITPADDLFTEIRLDSIPAVFVYDRRGKLARRFDGSTGQADGVSYVKQVIPFVEELITSPDH